MPFAFALGIEHETQGLQLQAEVALGTAFQTKDGDCRLRLQFKAKRYDCRLGCVRHCI